MKTRNVIKKSASIPTALIAGGAGFVGSHLCEALLAKGARVIALDNFAASHRDESLKTGKQSYVNHLLSNPNFALYDCDINNGIPDEIQSVDYIFHLAGLEEYSYAKEVMDLGSLMTNAFGTKNLLDLAKTSDAKFLLLSTTDVYEGRMSQLELSEYFGRNKIEENRYMLAEAKRYAEALVWEYYKKNETDVRIVRVPEIYGPRMNLVSSGNLGEFLSDVISGRELVIYGEGAEKEFYLYIDDAISGILKAMYSDRTKGNIFSLVPDSPVSILEIAYMVKGVADTNVKIRFEDAVNDGYFKPGISKIPDTYNLADLRWEPKVSLKEGVLKSLESFNYSPNQYSFKPAKLIDRKTNKQDIVPELFSLQDVKKETTPEPHPVVMQAPRSGANFIESVRISKIELPKISLPHVNIKLPHVNIPLPNIPDKIAGKLWILAAVIFSAFVIFVGFPTLNFYLSAKSAVANLKKAEASGFVLNTDEVMAKAKVAYTDFYKAQSAFANLRPVFTLFRQQDKYKSYDKLLGSLGYSSKAIYMGAKAAKPLEGLWQVLRPDTPDQIDANEYADAKDQLNTAKNSLLLAQADFKYVDKQSLPQKYQTYYDEYAKVLNMAGQGIDISIPVFSSLPNLLGSSNPKKYLILFQNSNELRATGGFIGSYGVLTLDKGKIKDLVIDDIYNPDGQIDQRNITSDVPKPIADFLKETRMHIRNANWDPDYTVSANNIEDLYFKVTGERVDGVIAVDLYFIRDLLKATGPIYLTAYNEEVNADNIYERAELHSEFNYQEGSDQKRSFLTVLGSKLLERLFSLDRSQTFPLAGALLTSLNEKHMLLYFTNDPINSFLKNYHYDGSLLNSDGDYLYVVDSNLGGTKANYYVKEKMDYQVSSLTRDGVLRATLRIEYNHTGQNSAWPSGPYTDYVRVLTKNGAKLTGATMKVDSQTTENIFDKVTTASVDNTTSFETSFILQPQGDLVLTLSYDLSPQLALVNGSSTYKLYWQKQPGTDANEIYFAMLKPFGFRVSEKSPELSQGIDRFDMHSALNADKYLYVKLQ